MINDLIRQLFADLKGSWRFRWSAIAIAWVVSLLGWLYVSLLPDTFESEATVYVDTSSALRPLLGKLTVGNDVLSEVDQVTSSMLGRPLLEQVARETGLLDESTPRDEIDELITSMRKRISIENNKYIDRNLYTIRYQDRTAEAAEAVVSSMLNIFVEKSLGENRVDTQKAQDFLNDELNKLKEDLEKSEQDLADFKSQNIGRMPSESGDYFARLQNEMRDLDDTESKLQLAMRRRAALQEQLAGEAPTLGVTGGIKSDLDVRISQNKARLEELELRFTDMHPDVISTRAAIAQLESQKREQQESVRRGDVSNIASDNPVYQNIQIELTNVSVEIETLREQAAAYKRRIASLQDLVDVMPQVEAELSRLTRDYDVKYAQYQQLLQSLEVAELSQAAEQSENAQFRIIDPPFRPLEAIAPNRPVLLLGVLVVGFSFGGGLAYFLNQIRPVFSDVVSLRTITGRPILGVVSMMQTAERRSAQIRQITAFSFFVIMLCALCVVALIFNGEASLYVQSLLKSEVQI